MVLFNFQQKESRPYPATQLPQSYQAAAEPTAQSLPSGVVLVCQEDIYTTDGSVLVIGAGQAVSTELLPKLIQYGAKPSQFKFYEMDQDTTEWVPLNVPTQTPSAPSPSSEASDPQTAMTAPQRWGSSVSAANHQKHVLILEPNSKDMHRLTRCLLANGFYLGRIHPVTVRSHLDFTLEKYQPDIVFISSEGHDSLQTLQSIQTAYPDTRLILMQDPEQASFNPAALQARQIDAEVLLKPIHRFAVQELVNLPDEDQWPDLLEEEGTNDLYAGNL